VRVLVTGANKGIGLGVTTAYAERGDQVIAACRNSSEELDALGVQVLDGIELTSDAAVARLVQKVGDEPLDVLVLNAGINTDAADLEGIDVDELAHMFDVNALGPVRVVLALLDNLREGSKIMFVSTGQNVFNGLLAPTPSAGNYGYRMSKAAMVCFAAGVARDLRERGVSVIVSHPGAVDTALLRRVFEEGRTPQATMDRSRDAETVGLLFRERLDDLSLADSPAWHDGPNGEPIVDLDRGLILAGRDGR